MEERKLEVLRAIVADFVDTQEPVGSKALTERHGFTVSPATVRNEMAALEEEGYITQPHTSAGRVPTDKGYRLFVDRLATVKPLSAGERKAIETFLSGAVDLDDVVHRSVRLLSQLTHQVAVVQYPTLSRSAVRHVDLVPVSTTRVMVVLITDTGRVEQRQVDLPEVVDDESMAEIRAAFVAALVGERVEQAAKQLPGVASNVRPELRSTAAVLASALLDSVLERPELRVAVAGTANLARSTPWDFPLTLSPVLEALEEHVVLLRLLGSMADPGSVTVTIGEENSVEGLRTASVVASGYGAGGDAAGLGSLGVLGPTRMDYPGSIAAVRAVARYVGDLLGGTS